MTNQQKKYVGVGAAGLVGLIAIRRLGTGNRVQRVPVHTTGTIAPYTPQAPVVLTSGESVYDPNSQGLINTPSAIPTQAANPGHPGYVVNVQYPRHHKKISHRRKPVTRTLKRGHGKAGRQAEHTRKITKKHHV